MLPSRPHDVRADHWCVAVLFHTGWQRSHYDCRDEAEAYAERMADLGRQVFVYAPTP